MSPHKYAPTASRSREAHVGGNGNVSGNSHMEGSYFPHQKVFLKWIEDTFVSNYMIEDQAHY